MITCSDLRCRYRSDKGKCTCKKVVLSLNGVHTKNMGFLHLLKCNNFEFDDEYLRLKENIEDLLIVRRNK